MVYMPKNKIWWQQFINYTAPFSDVLGLGLGHKAYIFSPEVQGLDFGIAHEA